MITELILLFLFASIAAMLVEKKFENSARWLALLTVIVACVIFFVTVRQHPQWWQGLTEVTRTSWIASLNVYYTLSIDYLSILLIGLTLILAIVCVLVSWQEIKEHRGFYYFNLLIANAGIIGVFTASDLFLFFVFWEVMLLPITALIAIWGHENRRFAAIKFFIFTQASSLLMLVAIIAMAFVAKAQFGELSFNYVELQALEIAPELEHWLMLGFFIAFAVKLPSVPVHSWLPDAHTQAPTAGSVLLAGVLLKTGAYGLIRFVVQLFPVASEAFSGVAITLGVVSILYGAKMAFAQTDMKRLVAYSSISHMGFITLALFTFSTMAYKGAIVTIIAHGLSSAALFAYAGMIYSRLHTRELPAMGGLWHSAPRLGGFALLFVAAAVGMPGLANFIGEFMVLAGSFHHAKIPVMLAALGITASAVYGMKLFQQSFHGPVNHTVKDINFREWLITIILAGGLLAIGVYPALVLDAIDSPQIIATLIQEGAHGN